MGRFKGPIYRRDRKSWVFIGTCTDFPGDVIWGFTDSSHEIKRQTFLRYVDNDDMRMVENQLGYGPWLRMSKDWHVAYYRGIMLGWEVVWLMWSGYHVIFASPRAANDIWAKTRK